MRALFFVRSKCTGMVRTRPPLGESRSRRGAKTLPRMSRACGWITRCGLPETSDQPGVGVVSLFILFEAV